MLSSRLRRMVRSLNANSLDSAGTTRAAKSSPSSVVPIWQRLLGVRPQHRQAAVQRSRVCGMLALLRSHYRGVTEIGQRGHHPRLTQALRSACRSTHSSPAGAAELVHGVPIGHGSVRPAGQ